MGMEKKTLDKWVKALRSGKFTQTTGKLQHTKATIAEAMRVAKGEFFDETDVEAAKKLVVGHCCLGVLATVCPVKGVKVDMKEGSLPDRYLDSIGLSTDTQDTLATMNDDAGKSFDAIADFLEERYDMLLHEKRDGLLD